MYPSVPSEMKDAERGALLHVLLELTVLAFVPEDEGVGDISDR